MYTKENTEIHTLKDGTLLFFDHCLNQGFSINDLDNWDHERTETGKKKQISKDDMQRYCVFHSDQCRWHDVGKGLRFIFGDGGSIILCKFHAFQTAFKRYTKEGDEILNFGRSWHP